MSKELVDRDGFKIVKSKRSKKPSIPPKDLPFQKQDIVIDVTKTIRRIQFAVDDLKLSEYLEDALKSVSNLLQSKNIVEIVSFGLGHISECNISKYQLAFLLCLKDSFKIDEVVVHDPIFYKGECDVLNALGVEVILENNEGGYVISDKGLTIVYLPHCPKQLTNNFLWSNWSLNLCNCILICNSFSLLIESQPTRLLVDTVPYVHNIFPHTTEVTLVNNFKFTDIFNDTSIHYFPKEKLNKIAPDFWTNTEKPSYKDTEEFITSLMIRKLNI